MKKVAIQGYKGCFHEQAARLFYGEIEPLECNTFEDLYKALDAGEAELQKVTDKWVKKVDEVIAAKEKDILTV